MRSPFLVVLSAAVAAMAPIALAQRPPGNDMVKLIGPSVQLVDIIALYEGLVGKRCIWDNASVVATPPMNINIPEVPREEAIRIIEITLIMNGVHIVPVESDPKLLKVLGNGKPPRNVAVPLIADPEPIPEGEQVIMYLVKLRYADPNEMVQVLSQAVPASNPNYAPTIVALPKAQSLLITENTAIVRTIQKILKSTDVKPVDVEGEFLTLRRASAKDVVTMLEKLFEKPAQTSSGSTGSAPAPAPRAVAATPGGAAAQAGQAQSAPSAATVEIGGGMNEDSILSGKVRLTADERTNRIYVVSRPENLPYLRKLIQQFDEDVPFDEAEVRQLKYVSSQDILDALVKAISDPGAKDAAGNGANPRGNGAGTNPAVNNNNNNTLGNPSTGRTGVDGSSASTSNLSLQTEQRIVTPNTVLIGNAKVIADNRMNAIIVIGSTDVKDKVFKLLDKLDVRAPQVMLSTVIGELTLGKGQTLGANYILNNGKRSALATPVTSGSGATTSSPLSFDATSGLPKLNLQQVLSDVRFSKILSAGQTGMNGFIAVGDSLSALVTALESTSNFRVTSRPSVFASNNKRATIVSGEQVAVATSIQSSVSGTGANPLVSNSNVSYKDIVLKLDVVPLINSDREVYLDILQSTQEQTDTTQVDGNKYPRISTRSVTTSVTVPNEGTLVLGGLIKQNKNKVVSGIPVLSRAPLIGPLFRSTSEEDKRTELVIMIRPSVTLGPQEDIGVRDRNMRQMKIPVNIEDTLGESPKEGKAPVRFRAASEAVRSEVQPSEQGKPAVSAVPVVR